MARLLKLRRGTTSQHSSFTGAEGECTVDTTKDTLVVHDGSTAGGRPLLRQDLNNIGTGVISGAMLATGAVDTSQLANGSVQHAKLDGDCVDGDNIANDSINSEHYVDGSIDHAHLAGDCVDGDNIADDSVNSEHIVADSIDAEHYAPGSVDATALATDSVTQAKIADGAVNEVRLQVSNSPTNGYVLTAQSGNTGGLTWAEQSATGGATGGGSDTIFWENGQAVTTNYTITNNMNAGSFGPITINSGITVTVGAGEHWTII